MSDKGPRDPLEHARESVDLEWTLGEYWGPACHPFPGMDAFDAGILDFADQLVFPAHLRLFDYWRRAISTAGGLPVYERDWRMILIEDAPVLYAHEFVTGKKRVRIRYTGHETERRSGMLLEPGTSLGEVTGRPDDFVWERLAPLHRDGRPRLIDIHLGHLARRHVKATLCELPFLEAPGGHVRFSIGAWGIPDMAF